MSDLRFLDDVETTAKALYQLSIDMDYADYRESIEADINSIEEALYQIKAIAQNDYNSDYWRTFARCLDLITEQIEINENIFKGDN